MTEQIHTIGHTVQVTHEWVNGLGKLLDWQNEQRTWRLLRGTLHALRDWLDVNEAAHLGAQLPLLLRGVYYEGWQPARMPVKDRDRQAFLERVARAFQPDQIDDLEEAVCCVFRLINNHVSAGEVRDVRARLPKSLRDLWPE